ncbi:monosaccharide ABC transporter substrate-binding protein (CUT2 family) [Mobilisporobacter senegalensis]|uniref:Monosaccharide ABC transporter substrate-binding protein (CUT2 family) n=1 Tax=Mobilisporobacter senegalensis TaxID=1329262 RepID=A0A3N1Y3P0_9FIRM|nr:substrate-binding domain-containing protein [Mobilisporobacter senegalensis]ROR31897.1 monosaccharide ABC transporter substrate-binding protein (CUT2 family) [Mobilisporobacter senegalensis]
MRGIFAILSAMLLTLLLMLGNLFITINQTNVEQLPGNSPEYHIQIITQNTDEHFWTLFQEGALNASKDLNLYVEFVPIAPRNVDVLVETVQKAIYSKIDGIALQPADYIGTQEVTKKALDAGIPVINYENDKYLIPELAVVGSNSYDIGYTAGKMVSPATNGDANIAVILDEGSKQGDSEYKNMKVQGIIDAIAAYGRVNISEIYTLDAGMFEAERLTNTILTEKKDINVIICTDEKSTPAVAQVLVDSNKVGDVKVIGYGTMSQTLNYIRKGVIYGTVSPNAYEIGYQTVEQLYESIKGEAVSDSIYTELFTIDNSNVDQYNTESKERKDENIK